MQTNLNDAVNTAKEQRGRPFHKGKSGNPSGRPQGSRNKATLAMEALLDGQVEELTQKAISLALGGDVTALRLCLERICPAKKSRPVNIELPEAKTVEGVAEAQATIVEAVAGGELTPEEGTAFTNILETRRKSIETLDLEQRISTLENERAKNERTR